MITNIDNIKELFIKIINNDEFISIIDKQINDIMKDKVIDHNDIPSIIYIIVETINNINSLSITINDEDVKKFGGIPFNLVCDEDKGVCYFEAGAFYGRNRKQE